MKKQIPFITALVITLLFLNVFKLGFISGFIIGTVIFALLHYNINKIIKGKK